MYPWKEAFASWAESTQLQIDALGLITILGADEVNVSVGRLIPNRYAEFLLLLGAVVLASNQFTKNQPNFELYNLTEGIKTTEIAGWLSRWLKAQDFHQIHHKIQWEVQKSPPRGLSYTWTALAISIPCHGTLLALTVLSADWWGFLNVLSMVVSIVVRVVLVQQNRAGIDHAITEADKDAEETNQDTTKATVILIMDDSKVITMEISRHLHLVKPVLTKAPTIPNSHLYRFVRWLGWAAFAVHIISIGMASLATQICTVVLIVASTILTTFKVGCVDRQIRTRTALKTARKGEQVREKVPCHITQGLKAMCTEYPEDCDRWVQQREDRSPQGDNVQRRTDRRRDLFIWLGLEEAELDLMRLWNLVPQRTNATWWQKFDAMHRDWKTDPVIQAQASV